MAKSQKRSNREIRKPKATTTKPALPPLSTALSAVQAATRKANGKV